MTESHTIKEIERQLNADKSDLAGTLADLTGRVAPSLLAEHVSKFVQENATPYAKRAEATIRENPVAFALAGAGLAWLLLGRKSQDATAEPEAIGAAALKDQMSSSEEDWSEEIDRLRASATIRLRELEESADNSVEAGRDIAKDRAEMVSDFAAQVRLKLETGLEDLSVESKRRVMEAREQAYAAKIKFQDHARKAGSESKRLVQEHPMIAAILGLAVGAAIVAALPKDKIRNSAMGPQIDRVLDEARKVYAEEKQRASELAARLKAEATSSAKDVLREAEKEGQQLGDRIAEELAAQASASVKNLRSHMHANGHAH
ncbi:hypothetical protein BFP70_12340 [Thioclava sp. SK-1]|uniref:hypothetical protein n=1 Tax=Thioclava sp. SK-1 TaxID=1889770 RepID=UPI000824E498|nr:hypothetical protein [Thioclava sp. SK-1]OCX63432.1 hypothetical protein BFP70_12340 [Thioclava sp. SK-1]